jgi:dTDP-D-glucose 4,6-dehydratase
MLEAARMTGTIRRFINVSADEVYGETSLGKEHGGWGAVYGSRVVLHTSGNGGADEMFWNAGMLAAE